MLKPITPIVNTLRGLLLDGSADGHAPTALLWCAGLALAGILAAAALFRRAA